MSRVFLVGKGWRKKTRCIDDSSQFRHLPHAVLPDCSFEFATYLLPTSFYLFVSLSFTVSYILIPSSSCLFVPFIHAIILFTWNFILFTHFSIFIPCNLYDFTSISLSCLVDVLLASSNFC